VSEVKHPPVEAQKSGGGADKRRLNLGTALSGWPLAERSSDDWEAQAKRIDSKIAALSGDAASRQGGDAAAGEPDDILRPPAPATAEEVQDSRAVGGSSGPASNARPSSSTLRSAENKMQTTERERDRDRKNLQDLARLASAPSLTPLAPKVAPAPNSSAMPVASVSSAAGAPAPTPSRPVEAKQGDSGIVDLKSISTADPKAEDRAKVTPLASAALFDDDGHPSVAPPPPSKPLAVQAIPAPRPASIALPAEKKASPWVALGGGLAVLAVAAAAVLMLRAPARDAAPVAAETAPAVGTTRAYKPGPVAAPKPSPEAVVAKNDNEPAAAPSAAASGNNEVDVAKLPVAENTKVAKSYVGNPDHTMTKKGKGGAVADKPAEKPIDPKLIATNLPPSPDQGGTLNDALKQASGVKDGPEAAPTPAATGPGFAAGSVPQRPSQGAVAGALGAVMPTVRACLQPDDPISRASVVFDSTGAVTSISVTGFAAGKPVEACIKSALSKAKVQPFAQPTYTAPVTIRPN
jgi:hypothetical protein